MSRIEQIKVEQKKLADELESEMLKERGNVLRSGPKNLNKPISGKSATF
jgi:hypothetical protein